MAKKIGKNALCPCGSGKKYKYCCIIDEKKTGNDLNDLFGWFSITKPIKYFCKENSFYFFSNITLDDFSLLHEKLEDGSIQKIDLINIYKNCTTIEFATRALNHVCSITPIFEKRKRILEDAINAHFEGKYTLSIPALFSQIEGILRDFGNLDPRKNFSSTIPSFNSDEWKKRWIPEMEDDAGEFNTFINKLYEGGKTEEDFGRNSVLHGINVSYYSEEHSLMLVLTILEIRKFMWFLINIPESISKK